MSCLPVAITCKALGPPANGNANVSNTTLAYGEVQFFSCANGFRLVGGISQTCGSSGQLDESGRGTCQGNDDFDVLGEISI